MRYQPLSASVYDFHRSQFAAQMKRGYLAIFNSNDLMPTSADGHMPFKQATDILHLSGVDQEESILLIFPGASQKAYQEILFLKETNDEIAIWEGAKLNKQQATELSGVRTVMWLTDFEKVLRMLLAEAEGVYLNNNEHTRAHVEVETRDMRFGKWFRSQFPNYEVERSAPIMHRIRSVKHT
ncbi:MAG: aminopeptidase P N-terminal domain-containing protein, partial [Flavobacteriales bacterium]|nr:aminopeptidase P N-terminal domain-containing protein [Flavobacteriales bacterium]